MKARVIFLCVCGFVDMASNEAKLTEDSLHPERALFGIGNDLPALNRTGNCGDYNRPCQECEGECENDDQCAEGLACFIRDGGFITSRTPVPGCDGNPAELFGENFCYNAALELCEDRTDFFPDIFLFPRTCAWVARRPDSRCNLYGQNCRQTCGYCRTREPSSMPSMAPHQEDEAGEVTWQPSASPSASSYPSFSPTLAPSASNYPSYSPTS